MSRMYFDVWPAGDLNGTALGELTQAFGKSIRVVDQAIGAGQFSINRHDSQYTGGWCAQDNLVRVRLEAGGPFDADDSRYVFAFFIESGDDVAVSTDEEGGETVTRGGRDAVVILRRAVLNYEADFAGDDVYAAKALVDGRWHFKNRNAGNVLRIVLRNAIARSGDPLGPVTTGFNTSHDSADVEWSDSDADWHLDVGTDYLRLLEVLAAGDLYWRMQPDLVLDAWDEDPGTDLSATVSFTAGVNIREAAERAVNAREGASYVLTQGTLESGRLKYRWVSSSSAVTILGGRREGFVPYQATPTNARLDKAGRKAIRDSVAQWSGPTTLGVIDTAGAVAFGDYQPGDTVLVDIPGVYDEQAVKVFAIILEELDNGEYDVALELEASPFDPVASPDFNGPGTDGGGSGGGGTKCGDCPPLPPYVPGEEQPPDVRWVYLQTYGTSVGNFSIEVSDDGASWTELFSGAALLAGTVNPPNVLPQTVPGLVAVPEADWRHQHWRIHYTGSYSSLGYWGGISIVALRLLDQGDFGATCRLGTLSEDLTSWWGTFSATSPAWSGDVEYDAVTDGPFQLYGGTVAGACSTTGRGSTFSAGQGCGYGLKAGVPGSTGTFTADWSFDVGLVSGSATDGGPLEGQEHVEEAAGDGTTDTFQTNYPYAPNSLEVHVDGLLVPVTETAPTTGTFTFDDPPADGAVIIVRYQNAGTTGTGAANPVPTASTPASGEPVATAHVADTSDAHDASAISILDAGGHFTATDVEAALAELATAPVVADLDDLGDVTITTPAAADRLRFDGSGWVNTSLIWRPVMTYDGTNWLVAVDGSGNAILTEA